MDKDSPSSGRCLILQISKGCVAISINICPWQDPMQFGIKVLGTSCGTPGFRWDVNFPQHTKLHHCSYISMLFLQHILTVQNNTTSRRHTLLIGQLLSAKALNHAA